MKSYDDNCLNNFETRSLCMSNVSLIGIIHDGRFNWRRPLSKPITKRRWIEMMCACASCLLSSWGFVCNTCVLHANAPRLANSTRGTVYLRSELVPPQCVVFLVFCLGLWPKNILKWDDITKLIWERENAKINVLYMMIGSFRETVDPRILIASTCIHNGSRTGAIASWKLGNWRKTLMLVVKI